MEFQVGDRVRVLRYDEIQEHPSYVPDGTGGDEPGERWYFGIPEWDLSRWADLGETVITKVIARAFPYSGSFKYEPVCAYGTELTDVVFLGNMLEYADPETELVQEKPESLSAFLLG